MRKEAGQDSESEERREQGARSFHQVPSLHLVRMGERDRKKMTALLGPHRTPKGKTDSWLTPRYILDALGEFDCDPCCPMIMPWSTARRMYRQPLDGLSETWCGRVWLNPPYSRDVIGKWMQKMADHGNGIALTFARMGTAWAQAAMREAHAVLLMAGRVTFCDESGEPCKDKDGKPSSAGCSSMLLAYGEKNAVALEVCGIKGVFIRLKEAGKCAKKICQFS